MSIGLKRLNDPVAADNAASIGNIMSPLVHIPFKRQNDEVALSGIQTFTRASTATYIDPLDGLVKTAAADTPRFERMSDGGTGILLEGASTNLVSNSAANMVPNLGIGDVIVRNTTGIFPDGTVGTGAICTYVSGTGYYSPAMTLDASLTATGSIFIKGIAGKRVIAQIYNYSSFNSSNRTHVLDGTWQRIDVTYDPSTAAGVVNDTVRILLYFSTGHVVGDTLEIWGSQFEKLPFASSYIPTTTTAVTRAADFLSIPMSGNIPSHYLPHTILFDVNIKGFTVPYLDFMSMYIYNGITSYNMFRISNQTLIAYHGLGSPIMGYIPNGKTTRACKVVDGVSVRGFADGVISGTQIGSLIDNPANNITISGAYIYIRNFRIYDQALTTQEIALA